MITVTVGGLRRVYRFEPRDDGMNMQFVSSAAIRGRVTSRLKGSEE